jgi:glycosyltransferase involved in cell wall biosynthesis
MNSSLPKISIVTPSFNQAIYLEKCIKSVLAQNYPNLEYIVMDGGSTDGSVEIIKRYEPYITYWQSQPDGGQAAAISEGFQKSTGILLSWINSDDFLCKGALQKIAEVYQENPLGGLFYGNSFWVDQRGDFRKSFLACPMTYKQWIHQYSTVFQGSVFFSNIAYRRVGGVNEKLIYAMEYELFFKIAKVFPTFHIPYFIACFRDQPQSKGNTISFIGKEEFSRILLNLEGINVHSYKYKIRLFLHKNKRRILRLLQMKSKMEYSSLFDELTTFLELG